MVVVVVVVLAVVVVSLGLALRMFVLGFEVVDAERVVVVGAPVDVPLLLVETIAAVVTAAGVSDCITTCSNLPPRPTRVHKCSGFGVVVVVVVS